jgi:CW-type Zinc Finger
MMDQHFNPTVALQAISRVYRYGQTKPVFVYTMLTQGTMEEKVYGRCVNKTGISFRIVDDKTIERCFTAQELADLSNNHLWVQCDNCSKWRLLMGEVSDENIPDVWQCSMNLTDAENNRCAASEKTQAWYEKRSEGKKGLGGMSDSPMARNDTVLQHLLSVTEEGKAKALVCDHHFHEALMETATVTETLQQAYEELATDDEQKAAAAAAASTASTNENQVSHMPNSLFKSATNVGAALATTAAPDPTKKPSTVQALLSSAFNALNLGASAAAPSNH